MGEARRKAQIEGAEMSQLIGSKSCRSCEWRAKLHGKLQVTLTVNDTPIVQLQGGHPTGDPFAAAVALVNMLRTSSGVKAGQYVTCGSWGGLHWVQPGDHCTARIEEFGEAHVSFGREGGAS
jgi:2-keto-4-pentenoate hydratase